MGTVFNIYLGFFPKLFVVFKPFEGNVLIKRFDLSHWMEGEIAFT